jgi:hypothetical protein
MNDAEAHLAERPADGLECMHGASALVGPA